MYKVIMLVLLVVACLLGLFYYCKQVEAKVPVVYVNPKDGASMVLIPAGEFLLGPDKKQPKVYLDAYYMYQTEVTVSQYRKFCEATKRVMPEEPSSKWQDTHPMVNVTWYDAKAYADWAGASLPTNAQWEKAARGGDGRLYPWGNDWPPPAKAVNIYDKAAQKMFGAEEEDRSSGLIVTYNDGFAETSPVGSFTANPYGVYDLAGNAWEWCADWYSGEYNNNVPAKNPIGPATGEERVLRGGCWGDLGPGDFSVTLKYCYTPADRIYSFGFRCVVRLPEP